MTAATIPFDGRTAAARTRPSVLSRVFGAVIRSRQKAAESQVRSILLDFDDRTLSACGYSRSQLIKDGTAYRGL